MANLSDDELREAAAEAGVSPKELRLALAERSGSTLATTAGAVGALTRGTSTAHVEGRVALPPARAVAEVRTAIERQTGARGHNQGEAAADIVGDGLTYKLRSTPDGSGGTIVRVDVDATSGRSATLMKGVALACVSAPVVLVGWLFSVTLITLAGVAIGVGGAALLARKLLGLNGNVRHARAIAAHALMEAEDRA